jgi:hypothetical protein
MLDDGCDSRLVHVLRELPDVGKVVVHLPLPWLCRAIVRGLLVPALALCQAAAIRCALAAAEQHRLSHTHGGRRWTRVLLFELNTRSESHGQRMSQDEAIASRTQTVLASTFS